eukprot:TRINITY_DN16_c0_g1_i5.p1 TRINITY_DN16_c0_g1~~TRINITY_DN16_c0_g1_i5.p1  ORF type:complete len:2061 (-),score=522.40 TRINITY_DN16_c0_g1_i5:111-5708(-)
MIVSTALPAAGQYLGRVTRWQVSSVPSTDRTYYEYVPRPAITSVTPAGGAVGDRITVVGQYFGSVVGDLAFTIGTTATCTIIPSTLNALGEYFECYVAGTATLGAQPITITKRGLTDQSGKTFTFIITPYLQSITPATGIAGSLLTVNAWDIGTVPGDVTVTIDGNRCTVNTTISAQIGTRLGGGTPSSFSCIIPPGIIGFSQPVKLFRFSTQATNILGFTYDISSPAQLYLASPTGVLAGSVLALSGGGFGNDESNTTLLITVGGQRCPVVAGSLNSLGTQVQCTVPNLGLAAGTLLTVTIRRGSTANSNALPLTWIIVPAVTSISPRGGVIGDQLTVTGTSWSDAIESELTVRVGGVLCPIVPGSLSPVAATRSVVCTVAPDTEGEKLVTFFRFTAQAPVPYPPFTIVSKALVLSVGPYTGGVVNTPLTLYGSNFGDLASILTAQIGGVDCPLVDGSLAADGSSVVCTVPASLTPGRYGVVLFKYDVVPSLPSVPVQFEVIAVPIMSDLAPLGGLERTEIVIYGLNLGTSESQVTMFVDDYPCLISAGSLNSLGTTVKCTVPGGQGLSGPQSVSLRNYGVPASNTLEFDYITIPTLGSVTPQGGQPGTDITITGSGFGASELETVVLIGSSRCELSFLNDTIAVCPAPASGLFGQVVVSLTRFGVAASFETLLTFNYIDTPIVNDVVAAGGRPGAIIRVVGTGFGNSESVLAVTVDSKPCPVVVGSLNAQGTNLQCVAPDPDAEWRARCIVCVDLLDVNGTVVGQNCTNIGGDGLPLGKRRASERPFAYDYTPELVAGSRGPIEFISTRSRNAQSQTKRRAYCDVEQVTLGIVDVQVTRYQVASAPAAEFEYIPVPAVTTMSPAGGQRGSVVTVEGSGFGTDPTVVQVFIGESPCVVVAGSLLDNRVACTVPQGSLGRQPVQVLRFGVPSNNDQTFLYVDPPTVTSIFPRGGGPGTVLTLYGIDFGGQSGAEETQVFLGVERCNVLPGSLDSLGTTVQCTVGNFTGGNYAVTLTRYGVVSKTPHPNFELIQPPTVDYVDPAGGAVGQVMQIHGSNFGSNPGDLSVLFAGTSALLLAYDQISQTLTVSVPRPSNTTGLVVSNDSLSGTVDVQVLHYSVPHTSATPTTFTYVEPPIVTGVFPRGGQDNQALTIYGQDFICETCVFVEVGGVECPVIAGTMSADRTSFQCLTRPNTPNSHVVIVRLYGLDARPPYPLFQYVLSSNIDAIEPNGGTQGQSMLIKGTRFGNDETVVTVTLTPTDNSTAPIQQPCDVVPDSLNTAGTRVECRINETTPFGAYDLSLAVFGVVSSNSRPVFVVPEPVVDGVYPPGGKGGLPMTIIGSNFGTDETVIQVLVSGRRCPIVGGTLSADGTQIVCTLPNDLAGAVDVQVVLYQQVRSNTAAALFTVVSAAPEIVDFEPNGGTVGSIITIRGRNFLNSVASRSMRVYVGDQSATGSAKVNGGGECVLTDETLNAPVGPRTELSCIMPKLPGKGAYAVKVYAYDVPSQSPNGQDPDIIYYSRLEYVRYKSPMGVAFCVILFLLLLSLIGVGSLIFKYRNTKIITAISPHFCYAILFGNVIAVFALVFFMGLPDEAWCTLRLWLPSLAFTLIFGCLFVKTWRIWKIFDNKNMKRIQITNMDLAYRVLALLSLEITLLFFETVLNPKAAHISYDAGGTRVVCGNKKEGGQSVLMTVLFAEKLLLLLVGCFLSWRTRHVVSYYNESKHIAFSVYNVLFIAGMIIPILLFLGSNVYVYTVLVEIGGIMVILATTLALFGPRLYALFTKTEEGESDAGSSTHHSTTVRKTQTVSGTNLLQTQVSDSHGMATFADGDAFWSMSSPSALPAPPSDLPLPPPPPEVGLQFQNAS